MELSPANRSALLLRFSAMFGSGRSYPGWAGLTLSEQMMWQQRDAEAAAIAKGEISAEHEAWLCTNQLNPEMPAEVDHAAEYQKQLDAAIAKMNEQSAGMAARNAERTQIANRRMDNF